MKKTSFIMGTILLASINFIVRSLGFIYRILLSRTIGAQAIGLYQMVFPFLMVLITIPTSGIPIAVSKLVAKENSLHNRKGIYRLLTLSLLLGGGIALLITIVVSLNMDFVITKILKNEDLFYPVLWSIPAIGIITFSSILRGFFYGLKDIKPAATAQVLEQVARIVFVLFYLYYRKPSHPVTAATIAIIGVSIGEFFGLLYLILKFNFKKLIGRRSFVPHISTGFMNLMSDLLYISIPITISRLLSVFMQTINSILIPQRLQAAGYSSVAAIETFGKISGMAMPLLFLPFTVTSALVLNIIPNISEELAVNNTKEVAHKANLALKITILIAIPITGMYIIFGDQLAQLIYHEAEVGRYLAIISYATLFLCMQHTLSGILHGMGKQVITTINFMLGMIIQLYCTYFLVANPNYGVNGFFIGYILASFVIFILNLITLSRHVKLQLPFFQSILKPTLCSVSMFLIIIILEKILVNYISTTLTIIVSLCFGAFFYCIALILTKTIDLKYFINSIKG
ncbi:putative polysaccharide biosynthesis protein [Alkaliphilus transvaalensis]|uniref:putative polysaccharide biosynthesis protein n=1 Tax=Alkaliphilus transvaalensis TaxID=114628 RepID=UPI000479B952|nr:polysaccharide biosynthesis protein [Alkaliphilus transvaalensis]